MPPGKWIDKKTATHFTLVHRPQNDPLIHDDSAPSMVLNPTHLPNSSNKVKKLGDLASELGSDALSIRDNEGEAASHGVYFDDTEYDYMQHMRDLGSGTGEAVFIESTSGQQNKGKGKQKQSLADALKEMDLQDRSTDLLDADILPSKDLPRASYQSQQDVPDMIAGFQPDMDPRLREVLEALEDEAYVDDDDDIFQALAKDAKELNDHEFDETYPEYDDGWESDATAKPNKEYKDGDEAPQLVDSRGQPNEGPSQEWLEDFKKFKKDQSGESKTRAGAPAGSEVQSSIWTTTTSGGRRKKRKGALTDKTGYSMTSSSLVRNEGLTFLDARFEKIEEEYNADMESELGSVSGVSTASSVQGPIRHDFDGILDEFLGTQPNRGGKRGKKHYKGGVAELDEIRKGLGPARVSTR